MCLRLKSWIDVVDWRLAAGRYQCDIIANELLPTIMAIRYAFIIIYFDLAAGDESRSRFSRGFIVAYGIM